MGAFVKICGLCSPQDVAAVVALEPDAIGFVFWERSKRAVTRENVKSWGMDIPTSVKKIGVFVDAPRDDIERAVEEVGLDVVQLHGQESIAFVEQLSGSCLESAPSRTGRGRGSGRLSG